MCERWVGDWTNCNILTPSSFVFSSTSFSFCWADQSGVLRAHSPLLGAGSHYSILSPTLTPTNWNSCRTGLYHCLTYTGFLWASHLHPIQPIHSQGYTLIPSTGCTFFSIDGWVEGQYITQWMHCVSKFMRKILYHTRGQKWWTLVSEIGKLSWRIMICKVCLFAR